MAVNSLFLWRFHCADFLGDFAVGFLRQPLPTGNRFAVVTKADGPRIMATDAAICCGLELAKLRPETLETLKAKRPPTASISNLTTDDAVAVTALAVRAKAGVPTRRKQQ